MIQVYTFDNSRAYTSIQVDLPTSWYMELGSVSPTFSLFVHFNLDQSVLLLNLEVKFCPFVITCPSSVCQFSGDGS